MLDNKTSLKSDTTKKSCIISINNRRYFPNKLRCPAFIHLPGMRDNTCIPICEASHSMYSAFSSPSRRTNIVWRNAFSSRAMAITLSSAMRTNAPDAAATGIFPHESGISRWTKISLPDFLCIKYRMSVYTSCILAVTNSVITRSVFSTPVSG